MPKPERMRIVKLDEKILVIEGVIGTDRRINIPKRATQVPLKKTVQIAITWEN